MLITVPHMDAEALIRRREALELEQRKRDLAAQFWKNLEWGKATVSAVSRVVNISGGTHLLEYATSSEELKTCLVGSAEYVLTEIRKNLEKWVKILPTTAKPLGEFLSVLTPKKKAKYRRFEALVQRMVRAWDVANGVKSWEGRVIAAAVLLESFAQEYYLLDRLDDPSDPEDWDDPITGDNVIELFNDSLPISIRCILGRPYRDE